MQPTVKCFDFERERDRGRERDSQTDRDIESDRQAQRERENVHITVGSVACMLKPLHHFVQ